MIEIKKIEDVPWFFVLSFYTTLFVVFVFLVGR